MRNHLLILSLLIFISLTAAEMPDFSYIVNKQLRAAEIKKEYYNKWMDNLQEDMRNMDCYDVRYYSIDVDVDFDLHYVEGSVISYLEILDENVSLVSFNFTTDLDVVEILMNSNSLDFTHEDDIIEIQLGASFNPGNLLELEVIYSGYPQNRLNDGMKFQEHSGTPIVFTMVSPKGARKWWPCKDTPADKPDSLDISITFPSQYISASNGTLQEVINNGNGTNTAVWHESYPICTYLTSFAVTNYQIYSFNWVYGSNNMMVDNFVYPEQYNMSVDLYSLCEDMLTFYSETYGEYPFITEKYGHATCTTLGALAMEHQTCTSFDSGYISDPAAEYTVAHELSHHWAGDAVSIGAWDHVWLKEGFASYSEALWAENLFGFDGLKSYMMAEDTGAQLDECLYRDPEGGGNHIFNIVIYNKGSWTIHMLRGLLGEDNFFAMLQNFFGDPELLYANILTADLENAAENVYEDELDWFFDEWYFNYGRPQYQYTYYRSEEQDSLKITLLSQGSSGDPFEMFIPLSLNGEISRIWAQDGFSYHTVFLPGILDSLIFDPDNWVLDYGYTEKLPALDPIDIRRDGSVVITWQEYFDSAIAGMNIYRKQVGGDYILLNTEPVPQTSYLDNDVSAGEEYIYKIAAVFQTEGNYLSKFSNEISVEPIDFTLDGGILLVDGTLDGLPSSPFPTDEEVDSFYAGLLSNYSYTNWDIVAQGSPPLTELANYSTVIWHADDISNYPFVNGIYNMKSYLMAGGNLLASCWKQLCMLPDNFQNYFLFLNEAATHPESDFAGAFGLNDFDNIVVDLNKIPLPTWGENLQYVNKFETLENAEAIFSYDSFTNDPNWENQICGQRSSIDNNTYLLGFPLYYMQQDQAENFVQIVLEDFGEPSSISNYELPITYYELSNYPNPFNPETLIVFNLPKTGKTKLEIFNVNGQKVKTLVNENLGKGTYEIYWKGKDDGNKMVSSGVYFYKLQTSEEIINKKMLLLK
ncbi:MAG: T9SS type A sorting domain-containing protein [Candidatus Cloacimonetes bacterium]|nr:T9SS type A sorting domain-containing protein [Candidatus Cloacimonadota bacterium]